MQSNLPPRPPSELSLEDDFAILRAFAEAITALDPQTTALGIKAQAVREHLKQRAVNVGAAASPAIITKVLEFFASCEFVVSGEQGNEYLLTELGTRWAAAELANDPKAAELLKEGVLRSWFGTLAKEAANADDAKNQIVTRGKFKDTDRPLAVLLELLRQVGLYGETVGNKSSAQPDQHSQRSDMAKAANPVTGSAASTSGGAGVSQRHTTRTVDPTDDDDEPSRRTQTSGMAPSPGFGASGAFSGLGGKKNSGGRTVKTDLAEPETPLSTPSPTERPSAQVPSESFPTVRNNPMPAGMPTVFTQTLARPNANVQITVTLSVELSPDLDGEQGARHGRYLAALLHEL